MPGIVLRNLEKDGPPLASLRGSEVERVWTRGSWLTLRSLGVPWILELRARPLLKWGAQEWSPGNGELCIGLSLNFMASLSCNPQSSLGNEKRPPIHLEGPEFFEGQ